jgi:hypothetical protein
MTQSYLSEANVDDLGRMIMALLGELWVTRDRLALLETVLEKSGTIAAKTLDDYVPTADESRRLEAMRDLLVSSVIGAPVAAQERSVEDILKRAGAPKAS